jgi:hypothetical protein
MISNSGQFGDDVEMQLLLALSTCNASSVRIELIQRLMRQSVDWVRLLEKASIWQLDPVVLKNLIGWESILPEALRQGIRARAVKSRVEAATRTMMLVDVAKLLSEADIPVVIIKGPSVAIEAFGDISLRHFADADLLVHHADLPRARDTLLANGFKADYAPQAESSLVYNQHALEFSSPKLKVELHCGLLSRHLCLDIEVDAVWGDSREVECVGERIRVMSRPHLFYFLCVHGAKHQWNQLRWICDVAQLSATLTRSEADKVVQLATKTHGRRILALALQLSRDLFFDERSVFAESWFEEDNCLRNLKRSVVSQFSGTGFEPVKLFGRFGYRDYRLVQLAFWTMARERRIDRIACVSRVMSLDSGVGYRSKLVRQVTRFSRLAFGHFRKHYLS